MIFLLFVLFPISVLSFAPFHPPPPPHGHGHHPFPSALIRNVSVPARRQFFQIISSNVTKDQIETKLTGWAKDNGLQTEYDNYTQTVQQHMKTSYDNLNKWLAGPALTLYNKFWDIRQNMGITRTEECQQIHQLLEAADPPLRCLVPAPQSVIPGPPPPNCFHPFNGNNEGTTLPSLKLEDEEILENNLGNSTTIEPEEDDDDEEEEK
uniref:SXP/RAL-2 family protein Ani s 5-like cation-binding domain-containing protein n=1 Tax=Meloidogyne incognita TaxID=6306 RepID=A0A914NEC5_MELIC